MSVHYITEVASEPAESCAVPAPAPAPQSVVAPPPNEDPDLKVFEAVADYQGRGWHVLPLDRSAGYFAASKAEQESFTCAPEDIGTVFAGKDVGLHLAQSKIVGIDVDCSEAVPFLLAWLPPTCVVGREGKPCSWLFYRVDGEIAQNVSFRDCDETGKAVGELGGVKVHAVVALPPSRHRKTHKPLVWIDQSDPRIVEAQHFMAVVSTCFAMALIVRRWPGPHNRHEPTLALAGAFARLGWSLKQAEDAIRILVKLTNDHKLDDRLNEVRSTYKRYQASEQITGLSSLVKLLDSDTGCQKYLGRNLRDWLGMNNHDGAQEHGESGATQTRPLSVYALSAANLLNLDLAEPEFIVHPFLAAQALIMLFAMRGVGKTWVALELAVSVAIGRDFLAWAVPKARRVLFIDGEMSLASIKFRLKALLGNAEPPANLTIISSELLWRDNAPLNISQPRQQQRVDELLAELAEHGQKFDLIILDNLSSLVSGIEENSNSELDQFLQWLVKLRSQGYSVMAVHHAGKNGEQRGASRREDLLDTVIKLEDRKSVGLTSAKGASFEMKFTKLRGEPPDPISLAVTLTKDDQGNVKWLHEEGQKLPAYMKIVQGIHEHKPVTQNALAKQLGCSKQHVSAMIKIGVAKGLLNKGGMSLTPKGMELLAPLIHEMQEYANAL